MIKARGEKIQMANEDTSAIKNPSCNNGDRWRLLLDSSALGRKKHWLRKRRWINEKLACQRRCSMCSLPLDGFGGWLCRQRKPDQNTIYCRRCEDFIENNTAELEIDLSVLCVDVRLTETINEMIASLSRIIINSGGWVVNSELNCYSAFWCPGLVGERHSLQSQLVAIDIITALAEQDMDDTIGIGLHTCKFGVAFNAKTHVSLFGENYNLVKQLATSANGGQILSSRENIESTEKSTKQFSGQSLIMDGFSDPVAAYSLN